MMPLPYREGPSRHEPRVYRGSAWATLKLAFLTTFSVAVVVGLIATADGGMELGRLGMIGLFVVASGIMVCLVYENVTTRIVVDDEGISTKRFAMRWNEVVNVQRTQVNDSLSYTLHGNAGRSIILKDELTGFEELCEELRSRFGKLPGDA